MKKQGNGFVKFLDKIADGIARWTGSWSFLLLHVVWFSLWLIYELDINMLTMIVSLEAIILMTVLLMSQNRQSKISERRAENDYIIDRKAAKNTDKILERLDKIEKKLK